MFVRNLFPNPAPSEAPLTMPAMSTNSITAGTTLTDLFITPSLSKRESGTFTNPIFGSIVQKGKFAAWAAAEPTRALNNVLLPTLGKPTIPQFSFMEVKDL
mmetsp:Transcript_27306/g.37624  ORF Transcript_27306/g.37624 Transcript_27306/m.37624 type:complete len:101 (+) Transcript_27306:906-1208(+)